LGNVQAACLLLVDNPAPLSPLHCNSSVNVTMPVAWEGKNNQTLDSAQWHYRHHTAYSRILRHNEPDAPALDQ
jgi:hypothetical protein